MVTETGPYSSRTFIETGTHNSRLIAKLRAKCACFEGRDYVSKQPSFKEAWNNCTRAEWMFWLLEKVGYGPPNSDEHRQMIMCVAECMMVYTSTISDEFERAFLDGWLNELTMYGAGDIEAGHVSSISSDVERRSYIFGWIKEIMALETSNCLWEIANTIKSVVAGQPKYSGAQYLEIEEQTDKDLCSIIRLYYPNPPKL